MDFLHFNPELESNQSTIVQFFRPTQSTPSKSNSQLGCMGSPGNSSSGHIGTIHQLRLSRVDNMEDVVPAPQLRGRLPGSLPSTRTRSSSPRIRPRPDREPRDPLSMSNRQDKWGITASSGKSGHLNASFSATLFDLPPMDPSEGDQLNLAEDDQHELSEDDQLKVSNAIYEERNQRQLEKEAALVTKETIIEDRNTITKLQRDNKEAATTIAGLKKDLAVLESTLSEFRDSLGTCIVLWWTSMLAGERLDAGLQKERQAVKKLGLLHESLESQGVDFGSAAASVLHDGTKRLLKIHDEVKTLRVDAARFTFDKNPYHWHVFEHSKPGFMRTPEFQKLTDIVETADKEQALTDWWFDNRDLHRIKKESAG